MLANPFMAQTVAALSGQLGWENFRAELKILDVKLPELVWITPTLLNSWTNYGSGWEPAGYRIDAQGMVHSRGLVGGGTVPAAVFNVPVGYRPAFGIHWATEAQGAHGVLQVHAGGDVFAAAGSAGYFSLQASWLPVTPAPPAAYTGAGWPLLFSTKVTEPRMVIPIQVQDPNSSAKTTFGGPTLDWERTGDGRIKIKSIHGLTPGRPYKLTVLVTGG